MRFGQLLFEFCDAILQRRRGCFDALLAGIHYSLRGVPIARVARVSLGAHVGTAGTKNLKVEVNRDGSSDFNIGEGRHNKKNADNRRRLSDVFIYALGGGV